MSINIRRLKSTPPPGRKYIRDWAGLKVRTLVELENGYVTIPIGTIADVDGHVGGFGLSLVCAPCSHCGMRAHISKVSTASVEPINP